MSESSTILVVDDVPENIQILMESLSDEYRVLAATSGEKALVMAESSPDLILLDIMMPGMDGYEVCRKLKENVSTRDIPIIFVTALAGVEDQYLGLSLGAADYISKPFEYKIIHERIKTHLSLRDAQQQLEKFNCQLEAQVKQRTKELSAAHDRLREIDQTKNDFLSAISHELRTPANGMIGIGDILLNSVDDSEETKQLAGIFHESCDRLLTTIDNALSFARLQSDEYTPQLDEVPIDEVINNVFSSIQTFAEKKGVKIKAANPPHINLCINEHLFNTSLISLIKTSILLADQRSTVNIDFLPVDDSFVTISIVSQGKVLGDDVIETFWEPFSYERSCSYVQQLGLEIPLAAKMIDAMSGSTSITHRDHSIMCIEVKLLLNRQIEE